MSTTIPTGSARQNIASAFAFARAMLENPALLDQVPDGATVILLPEDDPRLFEERVALGLSALINRGEDVYFRHERAGETL